MLPSDMNLKIKSRTAGYNNKVLVSDSGLSLGKNDTVNTSPEKLSHKTPIILKHAHQEAPPKNIPQPVKQNSCMKRKGPFGTRSNQCLRNMAHFSIMRGTRRGDPIQRLNFFLK